MRSERQTHEMKVIDAVVRGGGEARPEDAALVDFAVMIRAARPEPTEVEAASIDRQLEEMVAAMRPKSPSTRGVLAFGGAVTSLAAIAVFVALVVSSGQTALQVEGSDSSISRYLSGGGEDSVASSAQAAQEEAAGPMSESATGRKVTRDAQITLAAPRDEIVGVSDGVIAVVDRHAGYVQRSSVSSGDSSGGSEFALMVPAGEYQATLAEISKLAHVRSRTENTQDITGAYNQQRGRLARAVANRDRIAKKLESAAPGERPALRGLLARADREVARQRARSRAVKQRIEYVQMNVQLVADESAAVANESTIGRAMDRAGKILSGTVAVAIVVAAVLLPILLIALAIWLGNRALRRRRSDGALDAAAAAPQPE